MEGNNTSAVGLIAAELHAIFKMVAIKSLLSAFAMALAVNGAPSINKARTVGPGQFAVTLRFFPTPDATCDAAGTPYEVDTVLVPQTGTTEEFSTGTCYGQGPYGSVSLDGLQTGCTCTYLSDMLGHPGILG